MNTAVYLPWIQFNQDFTVGDFEFVRVDSSMNQPRSLPAPYDQLVATTFQKNNKTIDCFTVIKKIKGNFTDDLTNDDIDNLYDIAEILSLVGISTRDIVSNNYVNLENFSLAVQKFKQNPIKNLSIVSRRVGSSVRNIYPIKDFSNRCPEHVSPQKNYSLDLNFLNKLSNFILNKSKGWERVFQSLENFNLANTDYSRIRENSEFVLICGALERLMNGSGNAQTLRHKITSILKLVPDQPVSAGKKPLPKKASSIKRKLCQFTGGSLCATAPFDHCKTLRDYWIIDFYRVRNKFAHGEHTRHSSIWSSKEHMALSGYIFPLLIKIYLKNNKFYTLSSNDKKLLGSFDFLLMRDDLLVEDSSMEMGWTKAQRVAVLDGACNF